MDLFPSGTAGTTSGGGNIVDAAASTGGKPIDLRDKMDTAGCYARNESSGFPMSNLFIGDSRLGCKSDSDEQLILHIAFNEFVKVCATICIVTSIHASCLLFRFISLYPLFRFGR
jgi:PITH domain